MLNAPLSPWPSFTQDEADAVSRVLLSNKSKLLDWSRRPDFEREFSSGVKRIMRSPLQTEQLRLILH